MFTFIFGLLLCAPFGGVPEWPKGSDCKSDGSAFGGSNPPPSTIFQKKSALNECAFFVDNLLNTNFDIYLKLIINYLHKLKVSHEIQNNANYGLCFVDFCKRVG